MDEMDISNAFDDFLNAYFDDTGMTTRDHLRKMAQQFNITGWQSSTIYPIVGYYGKPLLLGAWLTSGERSISAEIPFDTLPSGLQQWLEVEWEDAPELENEVAITMLQSRRAIIASGQDLDYAERYGWTAVLQEVWDSRRATNFEGYGDDITESNNAEDAVRLIGAMFGDLLSALNENVIFVEDVEEPEFDDEFQSEWV
tara:strand:+ start:420 stop:1016 length:597 start_codon:yes stop_codon:yes gene_type:complete